MDDLLHTARTWLSGEPVRLRTRRALVVAIGLHVIALGYATMKLKPIVRPLVHAVPPAALPAGPGDAQGDRFGLPLAKRKEIFEEFAAAEPQSRAEGQRAFPGPALAWSAEDHRGSFERQKAAQIAAKHRLNLSQVYLCLDEGIRERWPGPEGAPLDPRTVPLNPRRKYGF